MSKGWRIRGFGTRLLCFGGILTGLWTVMVLGLYHYQRRQHSEQLTTHYLRTIAETQAQQWSLWLTLQTSHLQALPWPQGVTALRQSWLLVQGRHRNPAASLPGFQNIVFISAPPQNQVIGLSPLSGEMRAALTQLDRRDPAPQYLLLKQPPRLAVVLAEAGGWRLGELGVDAWPLSSPPEDVKIALLSREGQWLQPSPMPILDAASVRRAIAGQGGPYRTSDGAYLWGAVVPIYPDLRLVVLRSKPLFPTDRLSLVAALSLLVGGNGLLLGGMLYLWRSPQRTLQDYTTYLNDLAQGRQPIICLPPHPERHDDIDDLGQAIGQLAEELQLLYQDVDEKVTQLELAEITAQTSVLDLQVEKQKVEETSKKLTAANEEITLLNERLKNENIGLMAELRVVNQRLNQFLNAIPVGVIVLNHRGEIYYANDKAQALLGQNLNDLEQVHYLTEYPIYQLDSHQLYPPERMMGVQAIHRGISSTAHDMEIHLGDRIIPIESWETPIFDEGEITYAIIAFQDITERRKAELEKIRFTEQLLELNRANQRFVPQQFLQILGKDSIIDVSLGDNVQQEMTVMFSDIRNFTNISENMTPEDNFKFINGFLSRMSPAILQNHGFIDKYIGDAIMSLFSRGADDALRSAIAMLTRLSRYNTTRQRPDRPALNVGIGINTGLMRLGIVGSQERFDGTVMSDAVNLAARLENLTKFYHVSLLISHNTFIRLEDSSNYNIRLVDRVKVKGKSNAVSVYEVFDADPPALFEGKCKTKTLLEQALVCYHLALAQEAISLLEEGLAIFPDDPVMQIYYRRCQHDLTFHQYDF